MVDGGGGNEKCLYMHNLGSNVTSDDLSRAFSLDSDLCKITLLQEEKDGDPLNSAKLIVPPEVALEIFKLNGTYLSGREMRIENGEPSKTGSDMQIENSEPTSRSYVELDLSAGFDCYRIKSLTRAELVHAIEKRFSGDETKRVIAPVRRDDTLWKIETEEIDMYKGTDSLVNENNEVIATVAVKKKYSHRTPEGRVFWSEKRNPPGGHRQSGETDVLITLYEANTDKFRHVTNEMLTTEIVKMGAGEMKKSVRPQPACPGSTVPGKNKFFVLQNVDRSKISPFFTFYDNETDTNVRMFLNYYGKPRQCNFCAETHEGDCMLKKKIRALEDERREASEPAGKLPIKTYSDSTLRHVREQALSSDVDAMSGGTMGNILNAMEVDHGNSDVANVIMVAGTNELHRRMETEEFVLVVDNTVKRISEVAKSRKLALLPPPVHVKSLDTLEQAKREYLTEALDTASENGVTVLANPIDSYDDDEGRHPTREQTITIINFLDEQAKRLFNTPLKLKSATDDVICAPRFYKGTTPLYRFGCSGCNDRSQNKWPNLCNACQALARHDPATLAKAAAIQTRATEIYDLANPPMAVEVPSDGNDDQLSDGGDLTCPHCSTTMENSAALNQHFKTHHPEEKIRNDVRDVRDKFKYPPNNESK